MEHIRGDAVARGLVESLIVAGPDIGFQFPPGDGTSVIGFPVHRLVLHCCTHQLRYPNGLELVKMGSDDNYIALLAS